MITCRNCGATNPDDAVRCSSCGHAIEDGGETQAPPPAPPPPAFGGPPAYGFQRAEVPNYLAQSIIVTLVCCMPAGIVAIVYAAQANGKAGGGDVVGAMDSAAKAKTWCWVSFGVGIAWVVIWLLLVIAGAATSITTSAP